jgi:hypothetical protein
MSPKMRSMCSQAGVDGAEKVFFFLANHPLHPLDRA